jgi:hypothetical protein
MGRGTSAFHSEHNLPGRQTPASSGWKLMTRSKRIVTRAAAFLLSQLPLNFRHDPALDRFYNAIDLFLLS